MKTTAKYLDTQQIADRMVQLDHKIAEALERYRRGDANMLDTRSDLSQLFRDKRTLYEALKLLEQA
jgi:hypothetical protein